MEKNKPLFIFRYSLKNEFGNDFSKKVKKYLTQELGNKYDVLVLPYFDYNENGSPIEVFYPEGSSREKIDNIVKELSKITADENLRTKIV